MPVIDSNNFGNTAPAQTGYTGGTQSVNPSPKGGSRATGSVSGGDSVELSRFTGRIATGLQAALASREQRVRELASAVRSGNYQIDSQAVSRALVEQAITGGKR
jgi:anti-sigma28 factor (negative regulator of flagellin synthesis)